MAGLNGSAPGPLRQPVAKPPADPTNEFIQPGPAEMTTVTASYRGKSYVMVTIRVTGGTVTAFADKPTALAWARQIIDDANSISESGLATA